MASRTTAQTNARYRQLDREKSVGVWADEYAIRERVQSELGTCSGCGEQLHPSNWKKHVDAHHHHEAVSFVPKNTDILTTDEQAALESAEAIIAAELDAFIRVGMALSKINTERLYRANYSTFEAYVAERWDLGRARAYAIMRAAETAHILSEISDIEIRYESHAKELMKIEPEAAVAVYQFVKATSPTGKVTAAGLRSAACVIKEAMQTGAIYDSEGESISLRDATPDHVRAAITGEAYENMLIQQQRIKDNGTPRQYAVKNAQHITSRGGEILLKGLNPNKTYYVSVWCEGEQS
jgi:hypothetical protein